MALSFAFYLYIQYLIRKVFHFPYFMCLKALTFLIAVCQYYLENDGAYFIEVHRKMLFLVRCTFWLIGDEEILNERSHGMSAIHGIKAGSTHEYVIKDQLGDDPDDQVIWLVRFLTAVENAEIQNALFESSGIGKKRQERFLTGNQTLMILRRGLVGWKNFKFSDEDSVTFEDPATQTSKEGKDRIMDRNLDAIPPIVRQELADYIRGESTLGEEE